MFDLSKNQIVVRPEVLNIPEFKVIWKRDKDRFKKNAFKKFEYIYYLADYKSPYANYPELDRLKRIKEDFNIGNKEMEDEYVTAALEKYRDLQFTPTRDLLSAAEEAARALAGDLRRISQSADSDKAEYIVKTLKEIGKIVTSIDALKRKVDQEASEVDIWGGGEFGMFEL